MLTPPENTGLRGKHHNPPSLPGTGSDMEQMGRRGAVLSLGRMPGLFRGGLSLFQASGQGLGRVKMHHVGLEGDQGSCLLWPDPELIIRLS